MRLLSNHGLALTALARRPHSRIRDVAAELGVTDRAAQAIISSLVRGGYLRRIRQGRRNRYELTPEGVAGLDTVAGADFGRLASFGGPARGMAGCKAIALACTDFRIQGSLWRLLATEGLVGATEVLLWPGGGPALAGGDAGHLYDTLEVLVETRRPDRLLLVSHFGCGVPDVPTVAGSSPPMTARSVRKWGRRITVEALRRLGLTPELWSIDRSRYGRVAVGGHRSLLARPAPAVGEER